MPAGWSTLIDAVIAIARSLMPSEWSGYCEIIGGREAAASGDEVGRAQLIKSRDLKLFEAWGAAWPGEALRLEKRFEAALLQALSAELWESEGDDGRTIGKIHPTIWTGPIDAKFHYDLGAIEIQPGHWLRRVRLRPTAIERSERPTKPEEEAMPAGCAAAEPKPEVASEEVAISSEAAAAQEYIERLHNERESTGRAPTRDADYEWAAWVWQTRRFHVTQDMIDGWRRVLLTADEKRGGAPSRRK
jgi:hypothetical protein